MRHSSRITHFFGRRFRVRACAIFVDSLYIFGRIQIVDIHKSVPFFTALVLPSVGSTRESSWSGGFASGVGGFGTGPNNHNTIS